MYEFTSTATVIPITNNFQGYLVAKDDQIKRKDKVKFNTEGQAEKNSSSDGKINTIALSDSIVLDGSEKKLYVAHVAIYGNKGKPS